MNMMVVGKPKGILIKKEYAFYYTCTRNLDK